MEPLPSPEDDDDGDDDDDVPQAILEVPTPRSLDCNPELWEDLPPEDDGSDHLLNHDGLSRSGGASRTTLNTKPKASTTPARTGTGQQVRKQDAKTTIGVVNFRVGRREGAAQKSHQARKKRNPVYPGTSMIDYIGTLPEVTFSPGTCQSLQMPCHKSSHAFWEVFSPPRISPMLHHDLKEHGMASAFDLENGWDFLNPLCRRHFLEDLEYKDPIFVFLCPPCGMFSPLMFSNWLRMPVEVRESKARAAVEMLDFAMEVMRRQVRRGRYAGFEHPRAAISWRRSTVTPTVFS